MTIGVPQTFFLHADGSVYLPRRGQRALRVTNPAVVDAVKRTAAAEDARMAEAEPEPAKKPARKRAPKKAAPDAA